MIRCETDVAGIAELLPEIRLALLEAARIDPTFEPVPLVGRSPRDDALGMGAYLAELLVRAAAHSGRTPEALIDEATERVVTTLSAREEAIDVADEPERLATILPFR
jgi:hypothetical protein